MVRGFDNHRAQWEYGIKNTGIDTPYVLALDADMQVPGTLVSEIVEQFLPRNFGGGMVPFEYRYSGQRLAGSLCPPQLRVFRRADVQVLQSDHTQSFAIAGEIYQFRQRLIHDDQKPLERWVQSQLRYQILNEQATWSNGHPPLKRFLRRTGLMPPLVGVIAYCKAGGPFYGAAALRYAYERAVGEERAGDALITRLQREHERGSKLNGDRWHQARDKESSNNWCAALAAASSCQIKDTSEPGFRLRLLRGTLGWCSRIPDHYEPRYVIFLRSLSKVRRHCLRCEGCWLCSVLSFDGSVGPER